MPKNDQSFAYFRRWLMITFPHVFIGDDADPQRTQKLTVPGELSGLLNRAIDHLIRLRTEGQFKDTQTVDEVRQAYMRKANPVKAFAEDCIVEREGGRVPKTQMYNAYGDYCRDNDLAPVGRNTFYEYLLREITVKEKYIRVGEKKKTTRCYVGIALQQAPKATVLTDFPIKTPVENQRVKILVEKNGSKTVKTVAPAPSDAPPAQSHDERVDQLLEPPLHPGRVCGECRHHWQPTCVKPKPKLVQPSAAFAEKCKQFAPKEVS